MLLVNVENIDLNLEHVQILHKPETTTGTVFFSYCPNFLFRFSDAIASLRSVADIFFISTELRQRRCIKNRTIVILLKLNFVRDSRVHIKEKHNPIIGIKSSIDLM